MGRRDLSPTASSTPGTAGTNGATWLTGAGAPSDASGVNGDLYFRTSNGAVYLKAAGSWGSPITTLVKAAAGVFDQTANSITATATAADVNVGALTLLTDAITAIGTLQTAINLDRHLINRLISIVQGAG